MKAVIHERYGPPDRVLRLGDVRTPAIGDDEVLVRVRAASVHPDVWHVVTGQPYIVRLFGNGVFKPKRRVPGSDLAGVVEAAGPKVTRFAVGDEVFGEVRMGWQNGGTYAEYAAARVDWLARKPANVTFEQAASVGSSGIIALTNPPSNRIQAGHSVLVNGAGGNVGTLAVQIAKSRGARVTAVDTGARLDLLRSLGADAVIDFRTDDVLRRGERYDLVLDVASTLSVNACRPILAPAGLYWLVGHDHYGKTAKPVLGSLPRMIGLMLRSRFDPNLPKVTFDLPPRAALMESLRQLLESGAVTPVVARSFPLAEAPAALGCLVDACAPGRIVVTP